MSTLPIWNLKDFYPSYKSELILDDIKNLEISSIKFSRK